MQFISCRCRPRFWSLLSAFFSFKRQLCSHVVRGHRGCQAGRRGGPGQGWHLSGRCGRARCRRGARRRSAGAAAGRAQAACAGRRRSVGSKILGVRLRGRLFQFSVVAILLSSLTYPVCARSKVQRWDPCWCKLDLSCKCCWVLQTSEEFPGKGRYPFEGIPTFVPQAQVQLMITAQEKRSSLRIERVRGR